MGTTYFKRFRMEFDLTQPLFDARVPPAGYALRPWHPSLVEAHADAKFRSFQYELDANVFPCLGEPDGCLRLMREISRRQGFMPSATWLLAWQPAGQKHVDYVGTVQGINDRENVGSIQNLGIIPEHRDLGLGTYLLRHALMGFLAAGLRRASLEVTVQNTGALQLYERLGFRTVRTVYKAVEVAYA